MDKNMPHDSLSLIQRIQEYGLLGYGWMIVLAVWAGTVKYIQSLNGDKPTLMGWLTETISCTFVGVVVGMTCEYYELDIMLTFVIVALASHHGTKALYIVGNILKKNSAVEANPSLTAALNSKQGDKDANN